jgi:hypothetical protein
MALTFPLSIATLADLLPIESVAWTLDENQELNGLGGGELLASDLAPRLWSGDVQCVQQYNDDVAAVQALFESLSGAINSFYLYDPRKKYPRQDPTGSILGSSTVKIKSVGSNNKSIALKGLPAAYVVSLGDYLAFDFGSEPTRRALLRCAETVTADGSGDTIEFELSSALRPGAEADIVVTLIKPAAKVKLVPGSFSSASSGALHSRISFKVRQTLG